jgi:MerR family transcriptional regulator/heat shock protein HspR
MIWANFEREADRPVYVISVAARLAAMHPQTLRQYDRLGLVVPGRAPGRGRRYSARDVEALREIQRLSTVEGVNLAGIKRILALEAENRALRQAVEDLSARLEAGRRFFAVGPQGEAFPVARGRRPARPPAGSAAAAGSAGSAGQPGTASEPGTRAVILWRPR